jgi:hypothetical protein
MTGQKSAVVLVVRDEVREISAWLAWYHVLGFDACIVYDDDSTDGTWEFMQAAARVQDIRLAPTVGERGTGHEPRQNLSYLRALAQYGDEFAWMGFFDADEYLFLPRDGAVAAFLNRLAAVDAVVVNWCNYGSGGHYLCPLAPPFEAYTWHSNEIQPINRHVNSIVRPERVGPRWTGVHCFDVPLARTRLANGAPVRWGPHEGVIDANPDWSAGKLMHYQCRSMEHFIARLKRFPALQGVPELWRDYDFRQVEDRRPLLLGPRVRAQMARLGA